MGAVKSIGRFFRPAREVAASGQKFKRPPEPTIGTPMSPSPSEQPSQELLTRLKDVYVESTTDVVTQENPFASESHAQRAKLPQDRSATYDDTFLVEDPSVGCLTVQQVLEIFDKRREKPTEWTAADVARQYAIDSTDTENLLKYFNNYKVIRSERPSTKLEYHPLHR